jgi:glucosamine kinase
MTYVAGIDGGQTSTAAVIGDERGRILGRGVAGPADEVGQGPESTRMHDALSDALRAACEDAGIPAQTHFEAIVAGVSGYEGRVYGKVPQLPATRFVVMHDAPIAHAGALDGQPGVVVIAGTGSVVYATDGERSWTFGGWGYLFGDEGSAFWFAREALALLMHCEDWANGPDYSHEAQIACSFFGLPSLRAVARAFYSGELGRHRIAAYAVEALKWPEMRKRLPWAASGLAHLVRDAILAGAPARVAFLGGMFADRDFAELLGALVGKGPRKAEIVEPKHDPAAGALLLAYREAGMSDVEIAS